MEKEVGKENGIFKTAVPAGTALVVVHSLAVINNWYRLIPRIDTIIHFSWTVVLGLVVYWIINRFPGYIDLGKNLFFTILVGLSLAALGGVLWEFGEFTYDFVARSYILGVSPVQFNLYDTLSDLFFNLLGGFTVAIFVWLRYHRKR